jgi:DNA-binding LacI/PurR family transcriptional regulator
MSVVGFDAIEAAGYVDPPLTTVVQQTTEMGRWAVEDLIGRLRGDGGGGDGGQAVTLPVALRVGGTSAPPWQDERQSPRRPGLESPSSGLVEEIGPDRP